MTQNVQQVASDDDQQAGNKAGPALAPGAQALLDHLNSTLSLPMDGDGPIVGDVPAVTGKAVSRISSFGTAVARQADQIHYLVEQFDRLDRDTQVAELREVMRDLCGALNDMALRMKQDSSEVTTKIGLLTGAVTIISRAPDLDVPHDIATILDGAKAAAERLELFERLLKDTGAAILALEDDTSRDQTTIRELSDNLAKLNKSAESDRNEIAGLHRRIEASDRSIVQGLAEIGGAIEAGRTESAKLHQRIEAADQSIADGLAKAGASIEANREESAKLHQRIEATDRSLADGRAKVDASIEAGREESAKLHQRIEETDRSLADVLAKVDASIEAERNEIAQLQRRITTTDQTLARELTTSSERASVLRDDLGRIQERLESVENSAAVHAGFLEKIEALGRRLDDLEHTAAAEINGWKTQNAEQFAGMMSRLESLEQKHQTLSQEKEQTAARLQVAEQALATMIQSQKALSTWRDRITHVLLASPEQPAG
jgi:chromosome segregation ATPase